MPNELSGFEFIALDRLSDLNQRLPFDPQVMESLAGKGLVTGSANQWTLTSRGRSLVAQVMGLEG